MRILTICPSIYPKKLDKMLASFHNTINCSSLLINDNKNKTVTEVFNDSFQKYPDFDYFFMANDDIEFKTKDWDIILANAIIKPGISYGNDMLQGKNLCTFPMISGDIVRKLGWLQLPSLNRYAGDVVWKFIAHQARCLHYVPEVIIEHHWEGADQEINEHDMAAFAQWLPWSFKDVKKVIEVCNGKTL